MNPKNSIRVETQPKKSGGFRNVYIFICNYNNCKNEIKCRIDYLGIHKGKCLVHSHIKRPFESIYNGLFNDHRKIRVDLTYEQFLEFTKIKLCHYCCDPINWVEYGAIAGTYISRAYYLDRKDNSGSYSMENCVVCCTKCNKARSSDYSYEEWYGMTEFFRKKLTQ